VKALRVYFFIKYICLTLLEDLLTQYDVQSAMPSPCTKIIMLFRSAYGLLAIHDPFIYIPNIIGLSVGVLQLILFICFHKRKINNKEEVELEQ
jgi:hypothetical protein